MKNQFNLEIKQPCTENFNDFTPTKNGGFCSNCTKEVIDFTKMTSPEISSYFRENKNTDTCGKFAKHQLTTSQKTEAKVFNFGFWKRIGLACITLLSFNTITAQKTNLLAKATQNKISLEKSVQISGVVIDETGPLPGANILLEGTTIGTETDFDGKFKFPKELKKGDILLFSFVGMETKKVIITNQHLSSKTKEISITMKSGAYMLMGKVAVKKVYSSNKKF